MLPAYSMMLGLLALVGFMAVAIGVAAMPEFAAGFKAYSNNFSVPALFMAMFPDLVRGRGIRRHRDRRAGAGGDHVDRDRQHVTRNVYREFINPACTDQQESQMAKIVSLVIKAGALVFIFFVPLQYALWLQLLGGVWIIQTVPSVIIGLYTRMLSRLGAVLSAGCRASAPARGWC